MISNRLRLHGSCPRARTTRREDHEKTTLPEKTREDTGDDLDVTENVPTFRSARPEAEGAISQRRPTLCT